MTLSDLSNALKDLNATPATTNVGILRLNAHQFGEGEDLIMLHGLGGGNEDWAPQVQHFKEYYRCHTIDTRGHGQSDKPAGPYTMEMLAKDFLSYMDSHNVESAHVMGLSMGGMIALHMALWAPDRVKSLVLANTTSHLGNISVEFTVKKFLRKFLFPRVSMQRRGEIIANLLFPDPEQKEWHDMVTERYKHNDEVGYFGCAKAVMDHDVKERLGEISCPTLVITGDNDLTLPIAFKWELHYGIKESEYVVVPLSRHATPIDRSDQFNQYCEDFYRRRCGLGA